MNESRYLMFYIVVRFLPVLAGIGELVLGIMVAAGRVKSVKVLGIGFIMESISSLLSGAASLCALLVSAKVYSSYSVGITYISALCTIAGLVCMCIFLHKNYGRNLRWTRFEPSMPILSTSPLADTDSSSMSKS